MLSTMSPSASRVTLCECFARDGLLASAQLCEQALGRELHGSVTRSG